jgi:membrane-associated protein
MHDIIHQLKDWLNPQTIIEKGGLILLLTVIFAETGLFVGFFLPGDSLLFVAGLGVGIGILPYNIILVILITALAAIMGNFLGYYFGYTLGPRLFRKEDSLIFKKRYLDMTQSFYDRHGKLALVLGRFIPIIRTFVPVLAGAIKLDFRKFAIYNVIGALLWVPIMIIAGYLLGNIMWVRNNIELIVIFLIIITIIPVLRTYFKERNRYRSEQKNS